jgi:glucokinase
MFVSKKEFGIPRESFADNPKSQQRILLGDIGATNARFAEQEDGRLTRLTSFEVASFSKFEDALRAYLNGCASIADFTGGLLAVAGPIYNGRATLTNTPWCIDPSELKNSFGFDFKIVNDFEAVAYSLPSLNKENLVQLGEGSDDGLSPKVALGPGSGLGVACLIEHEGKRLVIPSEGGHASLVGETDREDMIVRALRQRFGHVSAERAISGPGLENIFQAIATVDGLEVPPLSAAEITRRAANNECKLADEALGTFCALLGSFAGNAALTFGARGGVYIAGGIVPRMVAFLARSPFRSRFEDKGRFRDYLQKIPSHVIVHPAAAFLGLRFLAEQL